MESFTREQLKVHRKLIMKHINNPELRWKFRRSESSLWENLKLDLKPKFFVKYNWAIIEPLVTSPEGEKIYEGDTIYWFDLLKGEVASTKANADIEFNESATTTGVVLSYGEALRLGVEALTKSFNDQFITVKEETKHYQVADLFQIARDIENMHPVSIDITVNTRY